MCEGSKVPESDVHEHWRLGKRADWQGSHEPLSFLLEDDGNSLCFYRLSGICVLL